MDRRDLCYYKKAAVRLCERTGIDPFAYTHSFSFCDCDSCRRQEWTRVAKELRDLDEKLDCLFEARKRGELPNDDRE